MECLEMLLYVSFSAPTREPTRVFRSPLEYCRASSSATPSIHHRQPLISTYLDEPGNICRKHHSGDVPRQRQALHALHEMHTHLRGTEMVISSMR